MDYFALKIVTHPWGHSFTAHVCQLLCNMAIAYRSLRIEPCGADLFTQLPYKQVYALNFSFIYSLCIHIGDQVLKTKFTIIAQENIRKGGQNVKKKRWNYMKRKERSFCGIKWQTEICGDVNQNSCIVYSIMVDKDPLMKNQLESFESLSPFSRYTSSKFYQLRFLINFAKVMTWVLHCVCVSFVNPF